MFTPRYALTHTDRYALTHSDGSSLLKNGDNAATIRGARNVKTRASDKGRYCSAPYRLDTAPNPKQPLRSSSHFLHNLDTLSMESSRVWYFSTVGPRFAHSMYSESLEEEVQSSNRKFGTLEV